MIYMVFRSKVDFEGCMFKFNLNSFQNLAESEYLILWKYQMMAVKRNGYTMSLVLMENKNLLQKLLKDDCIYQSLEPVFEDAEVLRRNFGNVLKYVNIGYQNGQLNQFQMLLWIKLMQPSRDIGCNVYVVVRLCIMFMLFPYSSITQHVLDFLSTFLLSFQDSLAILDYQKCWCKLVYTEHNNINSKSQMSEPCYHQKLGPSENVHMGSRACQTILIL